MKVEQIYTGCLAEAAYYIESDGEAAIIDPLRETAPYLKKAEQNGAKIKYVLETHFHADFVSGHLDLAAKTGAKIVYGSNAKPDFDIHSAQDGEVLPLGKVKIKVLHTPGHTMESTTFLLIDENGKNHAIFTGDTLFINDVGRPDLAQKAGELTTEDLAGHLYDSLQNKIMPLEDEVIVYPGHGAGSACGKNLGKETYDTLGHQKKVNYALNAKDRDDFVKQVTDGLMPPPQYFPKNAMLNKMGYDSFDQVLEKGSVALSPDAFEEIANQHEALILDTRSKTDFVKGFIPNSIFIGIDGSFAPWVGALITDIQQHILIVADPGREEEVVTRLARVGYDNCLGYLKGGIEAWAASGKETDSIASATAVEMEALLQQNPDLNIVDVRKTGEYQSEHIEQAVNIPLDYLNDNMHRFDREQSYHLHCASGYRSVIAASILKARGFDRVVDIASGFKALQLTNIPKTNYVCPSTLV